MPLPPCPGPPKCTRSIREHSLRALRAPARVRGQVPGGDGDLQGAGTVSGATRVGES